LIHFVYEGIFNVIQLIGQNDESAPSSMLWKPVVYQSEERSVEENTLMHDYAVQNNITWDHNHLQGVFISLQQNATINAFNVSFGSADDGREKKTTFLFF